MPPKGEGQTYFREIVTKEVWQLFWTWLLKIWINGFHFDPMQLQTLPEVALKWLCTHPFRSHPLTHSFS